MLDLIASLNPGTTAKFAMRREAKEFDLDIAIGKRPRMSRNGD
jgi:hypothetical protein